MNAFCKTLKTWRVTRRFSQLQLALEADISARHLSFLETGRARPSRDMVQRLGEALNLPLDARNQMLTHAGFAVRYSGRNWEDGEMAPIRKAVTRFMAQHMPYPALALDRLWTIKEANPTALALFGALGVKTGDSLLELVTSDALPPLVDNWPDVAHHTAQRLRTESLAQGGIAVLDRAADILSRAPKPKGSATGPVVPTLLKLNDLRLSMFATLSQFGTPEDVTLDDLKIEHYFPLDAATEAIFDRMASQ